MINKRVLFVGFLVLILVSIFLFVGNCIYRNQEENDIKNGHWFYNLDKLDKNDVCVNKIIEQVEYLKNEKLSELIIFDKYKAPIFGGVLKNLDISSSNSVKMFRTAIRSNLKDKDINFAGHYTIVSVGMTGWGDNYWIIDRENGKAFEFPYQAGLIDFKKDSNLIIINPKNKILEFMKNSDNYFDICVGGLFFPRYYELRPSYVLWKNNEVKIIDNPQNTKPTDNPFWKSF
ncbi:MAG: hypothetical protein Q8N88_05360 [Nanoarchaeota archaeon]|nr:hypothetical protein [Nanoarchaeota archaeon]